MKVKRNHFFIKYKSNQFHHWVKVKTGFLFKLVQSSIWELNSYRLPHWHHDKPNCRAGSGFVLVFNIQCSRIKLWKWCNGKARICLNSTMSMLLGLDAGGWGTLCQAHVSYLVVIKVKKFILSSLVFHSLEIYTVPPIPPNPFTK